MTWTEERIEKLKKLLADGLTASQIGFELRVSRNAIIGKVHRLGLQFFNRKTENRKPKPRRPLTRVDRAALANAAAKADPVLDLEPEITDSAVGFTELEPHHCRWPVDGSGLAVMFCGAGAIDKLSYCVRHCRMAYRKPEPRRSEARTEIARRTAIRNYKKRAA